jgi:hypothetical protein
MSAGKKEKGLNKFEDGETKKKKKSPTSFIQL